MSRPSPAASAHGLPAALVAASMLIACGGGGGAAPDSASAGTTGTNATNGNSSASGLSSITATTPADPTTSCSASLQTTSSAAFDRANGGRYGDIPSALDPAATTPALTLDVGAADGRLRDVDIAVYAATNPGVAMGQASVDARFGLVTFTVCGAADRPWRFVVRGRADGSSRYFDAAANAWRPLRAGEELNAVIPAYRNRNVGITPLTEAAWQSLTGHGAVPNGWTDSAAVEAANARVRDRINQVLTRGVMVNGIATSGLQIEDITRLPWMTGDATDTPAASVPDTKNGLYGTVLAGLALVPAQFRGPHEGALPADPIAADVVDRPSRALSRQLAGDLADGNIDLFRADGTSALVERSEVAAGTLPAHAAERATYSGALFAELANTGIGQAANRFGSFANRARVLRYPQLKIVQDPHFGPAPQFHNRINPVWLVAYDGSVHFWPRRDLAPTRFTSGFRQLFAQSSALGAAADGRVVANPLLTFSDPALPIEQQTASPDPTLVEITRFRGATQMSSSDGQATAGTQLGTINAARLANGRLVTDASPDGLPDARIANVIEVAATHPRGQHTLYALHPDGRVSITGDATIAGVINPPGANAFGWLTDWLQHPALTGIVSITARMGGGFAVDREGRAFAWGDASAQSATGAALATPTQVLADFGPIRLIRCAALGQCIALTDRQELVVWGNFRSEEGVLARTATWFPPTRVDTGATARPVVIGAGDAIIHAVLSDGTLVFFPTAPASRELVAAPAVPAP